MSTPAHMLIIGGTRGLGRTLAKLAADSGYRVSAVGRREPAAEDRTWSNVTHFLANLEAAVDVHALLDRVLAGGPLRYVVFCQRYRGQGDDWQGELDTTLGLTRLIVDKLAERGWGEGDKAIALVSSVFGEWIGEGQPASYHVAKAGLLQLMRYYAVNLGARGIRSNAVTPFTFLKDESRAFYLDNEPLMTLYRDSVPLRRLAATDDVARAVRFLCSPDAQFITGQNLHVDGGLSAVWPETLARRLKGI